MLIVVFIVVAVACSRCVASNDNDNEGVVSSGVNRVAFNKKEIGEASLMTNTDTI